MPTPLSRVAEHELIDQNLTDDLNEQNTAARVREVLHTLVASAQNVVDDNGGAVSPGGGTAGPLYATTGQHTDGPMHQKATTDALAGLVSGAPQWVAGPQKAGALVYDQGQVYRVKQDITNSTSAPGSNPANYEPVGGGYTKAEEDALLATKQGALTNSISLSFTGSSNTLTRTALSKRVLATSTTNTTVALPAVTLADIGTLLLLENGGGPGIDHRLSLQSATGASFLSEDTGVILLLEVTRVTRGTPYNDTIAEYCLLAKSSAVTPPVPAGIGTAVTFDKVRRWPLISSSTYTVSATDAVPDVCVQLILAVGASAIAVPATGFVKMTPTPFDPAKENTYSFCVRVDGLVAYYINQPA